MGVEDHEVKKNFFVVNLEVRLLMRNLIDEIRVVRRTLKIIRRRN